MEARSAERIIAWAARPRATSPKRPSAEGAVDSRTVNALREKDLRNKQIQLVGLRHGGDQIDHSAGSLLTVECALRLPNHLNSGNVVISEIGEIERTAIDKTDRLAITGHSRCWEGDLFR